VQPAVVAASYLNEKLNSKLGRQLQDPFTLCGGALPEWCTALPAECRALFSQETRLQLFNATAFGSNRGLQRMLSESAALPDSTRAALRPVRQKVRVARARLLESGIRAMELFAGDRGSLEVEYFGEEGSGLVRGRCALASDSAR
jgi:E3 ubiquitin-protein ligase TRIP12